MDPQSDNDVLPPQENVLQPQAPFSLSITFSHKTAENLDAQKYLLWHQQVEPVIHNHVFITPFGIQRFL